MKQLNILMDDTLREDIRHNMHTLAEWEKTPPEPDVAYDDMTMRELKLLLTYQARLIEENERRMAAMEDEKSRLADLLETSKSTIDTLRVDTARLRDRIDALLRELEDERKENREIRKALTDALNNLTSQRGARFASRSQKGKGNRTPDKPADTTTTTTEQEDKTYGTSKGRTPPRSELFDKALRYMDSFWNQLMEYTRNGRYDIDNSEAERGMRQLANERKNSGFYGSHKMAAASAVVYHSLIATCRKVGISVKQYFTSLFSKIIHGNEDWANLLPMTIGLPVNKI